LLRLLRLLRLLLPLRLLFLLFLLLLLLLLRLLPLLRLLRRLFLLLLLRASSSLLELYPSLLLPELLLLLLLLLELQLLLELLLPPPLLISRGTFAKPFPERANAGVERGGRLVCGAGTPLGPVDRPRTACEDHGAAYPAREPPKARPPRGLGVGADDVDDTPTDSGVLSPPPFR
jgi:hypothetical protein